MLDWHDGTPNAKYWVTQLLAKTVGGKDMKTLVAANVTAPAGPPTVIGTQSSGYCGVTAPAPPILDCNTAVRGSWNTIASGIHSLADCVAKAAPCKMANWVSYGDQAKDCSWYSSCTVAPLNNYTTEVVKSTSQALPAGDALMHAMPYIMNATKEKGILLVNKKAKRLRVRLSGLNAPLHFNASSATIVEVSGDEPACNPPVARTIQEDDSLELGPFAVAIVSIKSDDLEAALLLQAPMVADSVAPVSCSSSLFMGLQDTHEGWGLLQARAPTLAPNRSYSPPPVDYAAGSLVIAVLPSVGDPTLYEVYAENTTGNEPLGFRRRTSEEDSNTSLLRFTTRDFVSYSAPHRALTLEGGGTPSMKSIARDDVTGRYLMIAASDGFKTYTSTDEGLTFVLVPSASFNQSYYGDKDDLNLIHNKGRFVDMLILWQKWDMRYCDNGGCDRRRVVSSKTSKDGTKWSKDGGLITPDAQDAPELEFYRIRPFYVGGSGRLAAHVLNYATSPPQSVVGTGCINRLWAATALGRERGEVFTLPEERLAGI